MSKLMILIAGIPGTGKTTFAKYLSGQLRIPMISKDLVKEKLFDTVGFRSREEKVKLGVGVLRIMYYVADSNLDIGVPIILENNFETASLPELQDMIKKHRCKVLSLVFTGDPEVIYKRVIARDQSPERHRGHVVNSQYPESRDSRESYPMKNITPEQFQSSMKERGLLDFNIGDVIIRIDTSDFQKVSYRSLLLEVKQVLKNFGYQNTEE